MRTMTLKGATLQIISLSGELPELSIVALHFPNGTCDPPVFSKPESVHIVFTGVKIPDGKYVVNMVGSKLEADGVVIYDLLIKNPLGLNA